MEKLQREPFQISKKAQLDDKIWSFCKCPARMQTIPPATVLRDRVTSRKTESNLSQGMLGPPESFELFSQSSITFVVAPLSLLNSTANPSPTPSQSGEPGCCQISKRKRKATATATRFPSSPKEKMMITDKEQHPDNFLFEALLKSNATETDADQSFANSIVSILKSLPAKKNRLAKIEIQQLLLKYEFDHDDL